MRDTYGPGRSRWTTTTGWLMVASALGALACSLIGWSPYPPLTVEVALAGASAFFAGCWVVASYRARLGPVGKPPARRRTSRVLRWVFAFAVPFATAAAIIVTVTGSSEDGRRTELYEQAGWDHHEVEIVRLDGEPDYTPPSDDSAGHYTTDVIVRVPYAGGPQELALEAAYTKGAPEPGVHVDAYYAPGHPELGVGTEPAHDRGVLLVFGILAITLGPWFIIGGALIKSETEPEDLDRLRRFHPATHLPALAILLTGLVLLLPVALEFEVAGFDRLPAALAVPTPALALTWVAKRFWRHPRPDDD
ncbi:hypothetical protein ACFTWH_16670 [Streptomyces sp. NPDC057011]|uniref:hypothetical protein n=1 Tax=unclassified Streptomyces TaxID=2593676 RepID=UPI00362BE762